MSDYRRNQWLVFISGDQPYEGTSSPEDKFCYLHLNRYKSNYSFEPYDIDRMTFRRWRVASLRPLET